MIRRYWTILLFAHPGPGWTVTFRVNRRMAARWGMFTPALVEKDR